VLRGLHQSDEARSEGEADGGKAAEADAGAAQVT